MCSKAKYHYARKIAHGLAGGDVSFYPVVMLRLTNCFKTYLKIHRQRLGQFTLIIHQRSKQIFWR